MPFLISRYRILHTARRDTIHIADPISDWSFSYLFVSLHVIYFITTFTLSPVCLPFLPFSWALAATRSLGLTEALRSLETPTQTEPIGDDGRGNSGGGGSASGDQNSVSSTVETLPDVPGGVPLVNCKVRMAPVISHSVNLEAPCLPWRCMLALVCTAVLALCVGARGVVSCIREQTTVSICVAFQRSEYAASSIIHL